MKYAAVSVLITAALFAQRGPGRNGLSGASAGFVANATYDKEPPVLPADLKPGGILIFSKTSGFRDEPAIQASNAALAAIAAERNWPFFITENGAVMNAEQLAKFKLGVWNNTSGDPLTPPVACLPTFTWKTNPARS